MHFIWRSFFSGNIYGLIDVQLTTNGLYYQLYGNIIYITTRTPQEGI